MSKTRISTAAFWIGVLIALCGIAAGMSEGAIEIGSRRELLVDEHLIAEFKGGAELRLHHPVRREIAIVHDAPWEGSGCGYHTVFKDGDKYRMYYHGWHITPEGGTGNPIVICYAESNDGIGWVKPTLGLVEFEGSKDNNIILAKIGRYGCHDFSPFIDTNPQASEAARYKAVGWPRGQKGLFGFASADGIRWKPVKDDFIFSDTGWVFDTQNIAFWSELERQYVMYYRKTVGGIRNIARAVSKDFIEWKKEGLLDFQGTGPTKCEQFYTNQIRPYYRAPHLYIGFPARYTDRGWVEATNALPSPQLRQQRAKGHRRHGSAVTDGLLITSRDGRRFHRWDEAFLRPGLRTQHNWAYGDNYIAWHVVETSSTFDDQPRELSLYATESYFTGSASRLRRYTLRVDGFASIHAPAGAGEVITRYIKFAGSCLRLNFSTSAAGGIHVEIQDMEGKAIPRFRMEDCLEVFGDATDYMVKWKGGATLGALANQPVRLRFVLREADVYAFRFASSGREGAGTEPDKPRH